MEKENRLILRLQAALAAAEDRLCELIEKPENDGAVLMARAAIVEAERHFPKATYEGRDIN